MGSTFDKEITLDCLQKIKAMLDLITERSSVVETPNDFLCSPGGLTPLRQVVWSQRCRHPRHPHHRGVISFAFVNTRDQTLCIYANIIMSETEGVKGYLY